VEFTAGEETTVEGPGPLPTAPPGFRGVRGTARVPDFHAPDAGFVASIRG
jgi:hypothetical protein